MCLDCVKETRPDRERTCLDNGAYIVNFNQCVSCGCREIMPNPTIHNECEDEEEYEEIVTYHHNCKGCNHEISEHYYSFKVEGMKQTYMMDCVLCGRGSYEVLIEIEETKESVVIPPPAQDPNFARAPLALNISTLSNALQFEQEDIENKSSDEWD